MGKGEGSMQGRWGHWIVSSVACVPRGPGGGSEGFSFVFVFVLVADLSAALGEEI